MCAPKEPTSVVQSERLRFECREAVRKKLGTACGGGRRTVVVRMRRARAKN